MGYKPPVLATMVADSDMPPLRFPYIFVTHNIFSTTHAFIRMIRLHGYNSLQQYRQACLSGTDYWTCGTIEPDFAHVVAQKDPEVCILCLYVWIKLTSPEFKLWSANDLLPFSLQ